MPNSKKFLSTLKFRDIFNIKLFLFLASLSLVISVIVNVSFLRPYETYKLGDFSDRNIRASQSIEIEDVEATEKIRKEAQNLTPPVFDYDPQLLNNSKRRVHEAFKTLRRSPRVSNGKRLFEEHIGKIIDNETYRVFAGGRFSWRIERAVLYALNAVPNKYIIEDKDVIFREGTGEILINDVSEDKEGKRSDSKRLKTFQLFQLALTLDEAYQKMQVKMQKIFGKFTESERRAVMSLAKRILSPNLTFNKENTVKAKRMARESVNKVIIRVNRGEIIVREGESIERRHLLILSALKRASVEYHGVVYYFFYFFLFLLVFYSIAAYINAFLLIPMPKPKDLLMLGLFVVGYSVSLKVWLFVSSLLANYFTGIPVEIFLLLFPFISIALVVRIILNPELSAFVSIVAAMITGVIAEGNFALAGYVLFSGFISIVFVGKFEERSTLFKAGICSGIFQMFFAAVITLATVYTINFSWDHLLYASLAGMFSGIFGALVAEATIPVLEYLFNYTTNLKLLEFANTNHPLLRELLIKAPGTYQHSMVVGQLAGAGADAIGANSFLARVSSYYHDIGKIGKSLYFIENQEGAANPHDKLNPTMSARILISHVKDGVKLGKEHKLGEPIIDIIQQHHGTSLMSFFYKKSMELGKKTDDLDFRYPGPKPRSRASVLVMIADAVEAACRSLEETTAVRIQTTVDKIINTMFADGQFDETNITLKRLKIISQVYTKILISLYHTRIEYPEIEGRYGDSSERRKGDKAAPKVADGGVKEGSTETGL